MPYVDAPNTKIDIGDSNPKILIVSADKDDLIVKTLIDGAIDGLVSSGVLKTHIELVNVKVPDQISAKTLECLQETKTAIKHGQKARLYDNTEYEYGYDAVICIGVLIEEDNVAEFDKKSMKCYNDAMDIILDTQVPCIMGILTCRDYEQGLERAGIGRVVKGMNHGYFWATAALSEIQVRKMISEGRSDENFIRELNLASTKTSASKNINVGILCAQWNMEVNSEIVIETIKTLVEKGYNISHIKVFSASGSFELPGLASYLIQTSRKVNNIQKPNNEHVEAVVCIGSLIKGGTKHFKFISDSVERTLDILSEKTNVPCVSGVLCCTSFEDALSYIGKSKTIKREDPHVGTTLGLKVFEKTK
ncbi:hypothetical protein BB560_004814 [Smittium megazygosporum]|uniref:6,7-dimethyl-8-ribityllumazine synthase n=1 Tax=Smittium megazygosporum TaxID=133381 RepID=A0A2T9Z863_9FUNG|nr:hypothetical protein BB560_004814 [Smittium megazygosporum]